MGARWGASLVLLVLLGTVALLPASAAPSPSEPLVSGEVPASPPRPVDHAALPAPLSRPPTLPDAPPFGANVRISDGPVPPDSEQNEVSMGIDFQGRLFAGWNDYRSGQPNYRCGTSRSPDNGQTWSPSQLVFDPAYVAAADPVVTNDAVGRTYLLCLTYEDDLSDSDIQEWTSLDGGLTWASPSSLGLPDPGFDDKPWGAAWGDGHLFAIWTFFYAPCSPFGCNGSNIFFRASNDAGASWGPPVQFTTSRLTQFGQVDVDRYGRVHVTYLDDTRFYYRRSDDFGQTFTAPVLISDAGLACQGCSPARAGTIPALSVGPTGQDLYVVWNAVMGGVPAPEDIYFAYSHDGGGNWTRTQLTTNGIPGTRDLWPAVDVDHDGIVHVMWSRLPIELPPNPDAWGNMSVVYTNSTDGGVTFTPTTQVNDVDFETAWFMGDYQTILVDDWGFGHLAWCDNRLGTFMASDTEIYSAHAPLATAGPHFLDINPKDVTITAGQTVQYTATVTDPYGAVPADAIEWVVTGGSIDAAGLYSSSPIGTFKVRFYAGFRYAETNVTVTLGPLFRIDVTPSTATIPAGGAQQFTAAGYDLGGNPVAISPVWATDGGNVDATGLYTHTVAGTYRVFANDSGVSGSASVTVTPLSAVSLVVTPPSATITADQTQQFTATEYDTYGNPIAVSPVWTAGNGTVDATGLFTPWSVGTWAVTATDGLLSDTATITVVAGSLASIVVTPPTATITADQTQAYTATGYDAKGNVVPIAPVWSTDGGSIDSTGLYSPTPVGTWTVTATDGPISGTAQVIVTVGVLVSIVVTPPTATITADDTQQYTATGHDAQGNAVPINPTWSASGGSVSLSGLYTATPTGTFTITATDGALSGTAQVIVTAGALASIVVTPQTATITADDTQQYIATGYDAKGNLVPINPVWSASVGSVDPTGLYTPTLLGIWTVTAADGLLSDSASVTVTAGVLAAILVTPPTATITADDTQQFTATGYDAKGNLLPINPVWAVDGGSVSTSGLYTPTPTGTFTVTATDGALSGTAQVLVTNGVLLSIEVTPATATITADQTQQYTATGYDGKGNVVPINPVWSVDGGSIDATGLYRPNLVGTYQVTATQGTVSGTAQVTVIAGALATLLVTPGTATLTADETQAYTVVGLDAQGNAVAVTPAWSANGGGSISASGVFDATTVGTWIVTATAGGISGTAQVIVIPGVPASIEVLPATAEVPLGGTQAFTATVEDADGNADPAAVIVWSLGGPGGLDGSGLFNATASGNATVTATVTGTSLSDSATVNVPTPPASSTPDVFPWWILILFVIATVLILFLVWRRRKKDKDETPQDGGEHAVAPEPDTKEPASPALKE